MGENTLTSALRGHLDLESRRLNKIFIFETQAEQGSSSSGRGNKRTIDISISTTESKGFYVFCLEAKWIYAKDYVTQNTGAIKRFKKCEHGLSSTNPSNCYPLSINGIVAYAHYNDFQNKMDRINGEIDQLCKGVQPDEYGLNWIDSEKLAFLKIYRKDHFPGSEIFRLISEHPRIAHSPLTLHHFWVSVN